MEVFVLCVMCMHVWSGICLCLLLGMQGRGSSWGSSCCSVLVCASVWGAQSSVCAVLFVCLCSGAWWCHLWWARGLWSVIMISVCSDLCLILSFQIRYCLGWSLSVCLVFVVFLVLFLFMWIGWNKCICDYYNTKWGIPGEGGNPKRKFWGPLCPLATNYIPLGHHNPIWPKLNDISNRGA